MATNQPASWRNLPVGRPKVWKDLPADHTPIYDGPSTLRLRNALFNLPEERVQFITISKGGPSIECSIHALEMEDGSRESWLFKGYSSNYRLIPTKVEGCFNVRTGRGWIKYIAD